MGEEYNHACRSPTVESGAGAGHIIIMSAGMNGVHARPLWGGVVARTRTQWPAMMMPMQGGYAVYIIIIFVMSLGGGAMLWSVAVKSFMEYLWLASSRAAEPCRAGGARRPGAVRLLG